tara:strand:- start:296 stop:496 length:201 start_codon:yes stop_codon:yes gene_type:complete
VRRGDIKKLFINRIVISMFDIPSDKLEEAARLEKKPKRKIKGKIFKVKLKPYFLNIQILLILIEVS